MAEGDAAPRQTRIRAPLGAPRLHLRRTDSTNERLRELAAAGAPHGTLVTASEQTAGRGRHGRSWLAPPGACLLCSLLVRGVVGCEVAPRPALLPLIAGVALCDAIGGEMRLKWPNDVVIGERLAKVAGILVEARPQEGWAVIGIGVNVALRVSELPEQVRSRAASLQRPPTSIEPLLTRLLEALEARLRAPTTATLARWRELDALRGRAVAWERGRGTAAGIDDDGRLLVSGESGELQALGAGDVHLSATA
jgi:BirA family biotin operon repressor/biotin-[acetyl-CoA-carboxylase] ligase